LFRLGAKCTYEKGDVIKEEEYDIGLDVIGEFLNACAQAFANKQAEEKFAQMSGKNRRLVMGKCFYFLFLLICCAHSTHLLKRT